MRKFVLVPFLGANDSECLVVSFEFDGGEFVKKGQAICCVETSKAIIEVEADLDGYVYPLAHPDERLAVGQPLAILSDKAINDVEVVFNELEASRTAKDGQVDGGMSKKAEIILRKNGLTEEDIRKELGSARITEADVLRYVSNTQVSDRRYGLDVRKRVGIIGGVSGGGALIVIDSILKSGAMQPYAIFDSNPAFHGKEVLGVPVVGTIDLIDKWLCDNKIDYVVIAFNRNIKERAETYIALRNNGVPFCNVVDPTANIRSNVTLGLGNVVLGSTYIGACTTIGDNNFISSNVCLEHGNTLGHHNAFGPGVVTSGNVSIGDRIRFGTGIHIEPSITIGDDSIVASGSVIRADVASDSKVRIREFTVISDR